MKRSDDFKEFCEWHRSRQGNPGLKPPEKFQKVEGGVAHHPFTFIFGYFLDIHADTWRGRPYSFDIWWDRHSKVLEMIEKRRKERAITDYSTMVQRDMEYCIEFLTRTEGREPTLEEFKNYFAIHVKRAVPPRLYLEVDLTRDETGLLIRVFNEIINSEKGAPRIKFWELFHERQNWPTSKFKYLDLKRYLLVYDLNKAGLKVEQIIRKIGTKKQKDNYSDENVIMFYMEDLSKARTIINNTEQGIFPGFYGKYSID